VKICHPPLFPPIKGGKVSSPLVGEGMGEGYFHVNTLAQHSRNQSSEDKASGKWQVAGDVLLVTRHSIHVPVSKNLHKLVLIKMGKRSFYEVIP